MAVDTKQRQQTVQQPTRGTAAMVPAGEQAVAPAKDVTLRQFLEARAQHITEIAAGMFDAKRVVKTVLLAARKQPALYQCDPASVFEAVMELARLGLEPGGPLGEAALVPYGRECQPQPMYKGLVQLAYRSGLVKEVLTDTVHEGDEFEYERGTNGYVRHKPSQQDGRETRPWTHAYCVIATSAGGQIWEVLDKATVYRHRSFSQTFKRTGKGPWKDHELRMARKTALLVAMALAPKSPQMRSALALVHAASAIETTATAVDVPRGNAGLLATAKAALVESSEAPETDETDADVVPEPEPPESSDAEVDEFNRGFGEQQQT